MSLSLDLSGLAPRSRHVLLGLSPPEGEQVPPLVLAPEERPGARHAVPAPLQLVVLQIAGVFSGEAPVERELVGARK